MLHPHVEAESASDYANPHVPLPPLCNRALHVYVGTVMPWTPTFSEILHHFGEELCTGHVVVSAIPFPRNLFLTADLLRRNAVKILFFSRKYKGVDKPGDGGDLLMSRCKRRSDKDVVQSQDVEFTFVWPSQSMTLQVSETEMLRTQAVCETFFTHIGS